MDLTVNNFITHLEQESFLINNCNLSVKLNIYSSYNNILDNLIKTFFDDKILFPSKDDYYFRLNTYDNYYNAYYNINYIEIDLFIPKILVKLYKKHKIKFTCKQHAQLYCFMVENYHEINNRLTKKTSELFSCIVNDIFIIKSDNYNIKNKNYIKNYIRKILSEIDYYIFTSNYKLLIEDKYLKTDILDKITDNYKIYKISILFLGFDRYIYEINNNIMNINICSSDVFCYETLIDNFHKQININNRTKKLSKLIG